MTNSLGFELTLNKVGQEEVFSTINVSLKLHYR